MLPAARVTDPIVSPSTLDVPTPILPPGAPTVLIGGLPAARIAGPTGGGGAILPSGALKIGG